MLRNNCRYIPHLPRSVISGNRYLLSYLKLELGSVGPLKLKLNRRRRRRRPRYIPNQISHPVGNNKLMIHCIHTRYTTQYVCITYIYIWGTYSTLICRTRAHTHTHTHTHTFWMSSSTTSVSSRQMQDRRLYNIILYSVIKGLLQGSLQQCVCAYAI